MSLDTVVEDIREEARERREELIADAEAEAEEILADAEAEAEEIREEAEAAVEREIEREREQARSSATLEAKQERLAARRDALADVRSAVEARLADLEGDQRRELTAALLEAGAAEFHDVDDVRVLGREGDADLLAELCEDREGFAHHGSVDCLGGVVLESDASRVRVNNTFDSVLEDVWADELQAVSEILFGQR